MKVNHSTGWVWMICIVFLWSGCKTNQAASASKASILSTTAIQYRELEDILPVGSGVELVNYGDALKVIINSNQLFMPNSNTITPDAKDMLRNLAEHLKKYQGSTIRINGYTDNTGKVDYNQTLTERRAKSVYDYFCGQKVNPSRMYYAGQGMRDPIANNNTTEGRALNRRIEIVINALGL